MNNEKIESAVLDSRVKLHLFEPSNREIWTVVGKGKEYWLYPEMNFCSCPGFYFVKSNGKKGCYHLESIKLAKKQNKVEIIKFKDDEFEDFVFGIFSEI